MTTDGETLLPQYLGMYRITVNGAETYWMVMRNVFSCTLKMHKKYDLKGSTVDRAASNKEKVCTYVVIMDSWIISLLIVVLGEIKSNI